MKNFVMKYGYLIVCSIIMLLMGIDGFMRTDFIHLMEDIPVSFTVEEEEHSIDIELYREENVCYVFLPSYASFERVKINTSSFANVMIDSKKVKDGMYCGAYEIGEEYTFEAGHHTNMTLQFIQSANVAAMYIDTATGNMDYIHKSKEHEEPVTVQIVTTEGENILYDNGANMEGRGNSSWNMDKKPYSLMLSKEESILGMPASSKWVLMANAFDESNIRNRIVHDLAEEMELEWTPSCQYVDVYLNGSYNGLYILMERIAVGENHLDIDTKNGDFLCKADLADRWDYMNHPFISSIGRELEITEPKLMTSLEEKRIHETIRKMEESITSPMDSLMYLDLDSWVSRYLLDEIFANGDADLTSSYFYCKDGIFHAGPIWDYDNTMGNTIRNENPCAFTAKNYRKAPYFDSQYYEALYKNPVFYERMTEMYETEFVPAVQRLIDSEIDILAESIETASMMNSIRWNKMYAESDAKVKTVDEIKEYLKLRVAFLNSAWIDNVDYCTVQLELVQRGSYFNTAVIRGECLDKAYLRNEDIVWLNAETGEVYDITQPIVEDIQLVQER